MDDNTTDACLLFCPCKLKTHIPLRNTLMTLLVKYADYSHTSVMIYGSQTGRGQIRGNQFQTEDKWLEE